MPNPFKATTVDMVSVIARVTGLTTRQVWKAHPLRGYGRDGLRQHYIHCLNALDLGCDVKTAADVGECRMLAMVFGNDSLLHPLDQGRKT